MDPRITHFSSRQAGVVARRQLCAAGAAPHDVRRLLRRRDLAVLHPGVYLTHTGEPTWPQRAWAAVLSTAQFDTVGQPHGTALSHGSALHVERRTEPPRAEPIHICIDESRHIDRPSGVVLHRRSCLNAHLRRNAQPPRIHFDESVIDVAAEARPTAAVGVLAQAVSERRTTARRLLGVANARQRLRQRRWIIDVLADIGAGSHSVLERGYVTEVLRPHRLPVPQRQLCEATAIGVVYRDAVYRGMTIELDGRAHHASREQHQADLDRDLIAAVSGLQTLRLGWGQVFDTPCRTAAVLSHLLGISGQPCGRDCGPPTTNRWISANM